MPNAERMFDCELMDAESLSGEMVPYLLPPENGVKYFDYYRIPSTTYAS